MPARTLESGNAAGSAPTSAGAASAALAANLIAWLYCLVHIARALKVGMREAFPWGHNGKVLALGLVALGASIGAAHLLPDGLPSWQRLCAKVFVFGAFHALLAWPCASG